MDVLFVGGCATDHYNDNYRFVNVRQREPPTLFSLHMLFIPCPSRSVVVVWVQETVAAAGASRCVSAMVVSLSGARKILHELPFHSPYDIHLNQVGTQPTSQPA